MTLQNELRGFVHEGVFTALTQYNNLICFPGQVEIKTEVESKVKAFMGDILVAMSGQLESFVADIVVNEAGQVWLVEVNPFGELAGSCLFGWSKDR